MLRSLAKYWLLDIKHSPWGKKARRLAGGLGALLSKLGLNFEDESYRVDGAQSTFEGSVTHSASTNGTMTGGYGPELVPNGDFTNGLTNWTTEGAPTTLEVVDNQLHVVGGHNTGVRIDNSVLGLLNSKTYEFEIRCKVITGGIKFQWGYAVSPLDTQPDSSNASGFTIFRGIASSLNAASYLVVVALGSSEFYVDSVSIREMPAIKWRPHNLWDVSTNPLAVGRYNTLRVSASDGTSELNLISSLSDHTFAKITAQVFATPTTMNYRTGGAGVAGEQLLGVIFHAGTHDWFFLGAQFGSTDRIWFNAQTGQLGSSTASQAKIKDLGGGFYLVSGVFTCTGAATISVYFASGDGNIQVTTDGTETIYVSAYHCGRSDLGGMVDNPDRGDSYVPTTSSAVYLPRRGHHIYNGYEWVNEGMLHESEARVNLFNQSSPSSIGYNGNSGASSTTGQANALTNENDAAIITAIAGTGFHYAGSNAHFSTPAVAITITTTVWIERGTSRYVFFEVYGPGPTYEASYIIDLDTLNSTELIAADVAIQVSEFGPDVFQLSISENTNGSVGTPYIRVGPHDGSGTASWTASGTETVKLLAVQVEVGAANSSAPTPSSYIPTSGAAVTRAAESLIIPAANLPWPTPNVIGSELVTNGGFDTDSDWVKGTGWTISGGQLSHAAGTASNATQNITLTTGKVYRATCDVIACSGGSGALQFRLGGTTTGVTITGSDVGQSVEVIYVAEGNTQIAPYAGSGTTLIVDNVSVKEIDPLSVSIQMNGRMTYADTDSSTEVAFWRWGAVGNWLRWEVQTLGTNIGRLVFQQAKDTVYETLTDDAYSPGVFVPFNIAGRHGSTFINGAVDGVALTADTTATGLVDLSTSDFNLGYDFMGTIQNFQIWDRDIGDTGLVDETAPSLEPSLFLTFDGTTGSYTVTDWSE